MYLAKFISVLFPLFFYILVGAVSRRAGLIREKDKAVLDKVIIYLALPSLIFTVVYGSNFSADLLKIPLVGWVAMAVSFLAAWAITKVRPPQGEKASFLLTASIGNTGYFGYPLALALYGQAGFVGALFYDLFASVPFVFTIGILVAGNLGGKGGKINPAWEIVAFPPFLALIIAYVLKTAATAGLPLLPIVFLDTVGALGAVAIPLIVVSIGVSLKIASVRQFWSSILLVSVVKLLISPLVAYLVGVSILDRQALGVTVLEASMPTFMLSMVIGSRYDLDSSFISAAILFTTVATAVTVPFWQSVFGLG